MNNYCIINIFCSLIVLNATSDTMLMYIMYKWIFNYFIIINILCTLAIYLSGFRQHNINVYYVKWIFILRKCVIEMISVYKKELNSSNYESSNLNANIGKMSTHK